jgi:hypothetical protein
VTHIQQIKALCPEALGWEHILAVNPATKKQEQQLLLKLPADAGKTKQSADTAQMQQQFFKCLQQHMLKHKVGTKLFCTYGALVVVMQALCGSCMPERRHAFTAAQLHACIAAHDACVCLTA